MVLFRLGFAILLALQATAQDRRPLRIIAFGAHPDDNELRVGGTAILWARQGHKVKFVSVTNGDAGHDKIAGGPLALKRAEEVRRAAKIMGIESQVLDNHDGELLPTLENRKTITRLIREWEADIVITHRTNDYHPDHRYTGILVQDAAYMVTVRFFCPDVPALKKNPAFFYNYDNFQKPVPFRPDVIVATDAAMEQKVKALVEIESQFIDTWYPDPPLDKQDPRVRQTRVEKLLSRDTMPVRLHQELLNEYYGPKAGTIRYAEAFEMCEYGRRADRKELRTLFPIQE